MKTKIKRLNSFQRVLRRYAEAFAPASLAARLLGEQLGAPVPVATFNNWLQGRNRPGAVLRSQIVKAIEPLL